MRVIDTMVVFGEHDDRTLAQLKRCASDEHVAGAVLCADGHAGYAMPIGGVIAYRDAISPSGVGYDIACGIIGVKTDMREEDLRPHIATVVERYRLDVLYRWLEGAYGENL